MSWLVHLVLLAGIVAIVSPANFPKTWKKCPKKDNEDCLKTAVHQVVTGLKNGNKALGIIPLEPLHFSRMEIAQTGSRPVSLNLTFYELDLVGSSKMKIDSIKVNWDEYSVDVRLTIPGTSNLIGDYTSSGKILVLPINGKGKANLTFVDMEIDFILRGSELIKNGKKYFNVDKGEFKMFPKRAYFQFDDLIGADPTLGNNVNTFLNENWKLIIDELRNSISLAIGEGMRQVANTFFHKVSIDQLYT